MFELVTFGTNYILQTANETVSHYLNVALRYFGPFLAKRLLEVIDTLVFFNANLTFHNTRDTIPMDWYPEILVAIVLWK